MLNWGAPVTALLSLPIESESPVNHSKLIETMMHILFWFMKGMDHRKIIKTGVQH